MNHIKTLTILVISCATALGGEPIDVSGIYPRLAMHNEGRECGTGAVVPWQGSLWAVTYSPHKPGGSDDKLYEIGPDLEQVVFEESVGGTPANRMIHRESDQLLIGPYLIDAKKQIRIIPPTVMFGRLTGNARHLTDPENKIYYATMEEGFYEVDVRTLEVTCFLRDGNDGAPEVGLVSRLPGYHGKGLYSGQGRVIYANNGDRGPRVLVDPTVPSGALGEWFGHGDWQLVRRNQFSEVTGPGGIYGNAHPDTDPVWAMGWDARSLILALLEDRQWHYYRLPKGSHSYDGAHGWNTEWPRIREIGETDLLATMHGTFWRFPVDFSRKNSAGIAPRSNYLKVVADFCRWNDRIVFACDDSAMSEFLNTRTFKARHGSPRQSNSNLWFADPSRIDQLGPPIGRGSVWLRDDLASGQTSDPFLFSGYDYRQLHLSHKTDTAIRIALHVDRFGTDDWQPLWEIVVPANGSVSRIFGQNETGAWIRLTCDETAESVTANFQYRNQDTRETKNDTMFAGIATVDQPAATYGILRSLAHDRLGLVAGPHRDGQDAKYYEMNPKMEIVPVEDRPDSKELVTAACQPSNVVTVDAASIVLVEEGKRYRLPKDERYVALKEVAPSDGKRLQDYLDESLALGAQVAVSSTHDEYTGEHAVDGSLEDDARWIGRNEGETWIELDLGRPQKIQSLWIVTGWQHSVRYVAADFDVQVQQEGQWCTVPGGSIRENSSIQVEIALDTPISVQKVRVVSDTNEYFRIYEIALFDRKLDVVSDQSRFATMRVCREVATERDLLNLHGTFYELPARNAQGLAKIRPVCTHGLAIHDFCSHNGMLLMTGIDNDVDNPKHLFRSEDGNAAVWAGVVDDLWKLGKPRGHGGPWCETRVLPEQPSDPYLMTAYDRKQVSISSSEKATIRLEVDVDGTGLWIPYQSFPLAAGQSLDHHFPEGFSAYWIRAISNTETTATVMLTYD